MKEPIIVTERAKNQLSELCEFHGQKYVLFSATQKGCSGHTFKLDFVSEERIGKFDERIDFGSSCLVIDGKSLLFLLGTTIDYVEDTFGSRFSFSNPKIQATCGCGESFHF